MLKTKHFRKQTLRILGYGALPHRPTKGLSVFDCFFLPLAATTENLFGNLRAKIHRFILEISDL